MQTDRLKTRLTRDRAMTTITLRIPVDVVESMKTIAPKRGFAGYQTLLKTYISDGLRRDEAVLTEPGHARLMQALQRHGVPSETIAQLERELA